MSYTAIVYRGREVAMQTSHCRYRLISALPLCCAEIRAYKSSYETDTWAELHTIRMAFGDKCVIMNSPKDINSSPSVYTACNKESASSIVLEFAMASTTDNPLHVHRDRMLVL